MPEPVSAVGVWLLGGYAALSACARADSAVSPAAKAVREAAYSVVKSAERSQVLFGGKANVLSQLGALAAECGEANWDGSGALAVETGAVLNAGDFIRALPAGIPIPEIAPEPDGSLSLDWIESRNRLFSLSVSAGPRLAYAWLDGTDRGHGVARFDREKIPARVLEGIFGIMSHGNAAVRPS
jgi:hypothetical protein